MRKKIEWAVVLIIAAALILINALGIFPEVAWTWILVLVFLTFLTLRALFKKDWVFLVPLSLIPCGCLKAGLIPENTVLYEYIDNLTPWPLLIAAILLTIAFNVLFGHAKVSVKYNGKDVDGHVESFEDGETIKLDNCFGSTSKYVNSNNMRRAVIDNSFGQASIYFDNAILSPDGALIDVDTSFGEVNIYIPSTWRTDIKRDAAFGGVKEHGTANADMDAPLVRIDVDCSFGEVNIYHN